MSTHDNNSIPDLVELCLRIAPIGEDGQRDVKTDLRIHPISLDGPHGVTFSVSLKKATLDMELNGVAVTPGSRHGEPTRSNFEILEVNISSERAVEDASSGEVGAKGSVVGVELSGKGSTSSAAKSKDVRSHTEQRKHHRVRAMGNLKWEVSEPHWEPQVLDLTYLDNEAICRVGANDGANFKSIELKAIAKQKDIAIEITKANFPKFLNPNQQKLMSILISKSLTSKEKHNGIVTFSESVCEIED